MSTTLLATPNKPWRPTFRQSVPELIGALATLGITLAVVALSPLKGKLGFVGALFIVAIVVSALITGFRRDRKAAFNSISTIFVYVAANLVIAPHASILYEIVSRGIGGLSLGIFTADMSVTASDAPLEEGGLLHALIG